MNKIIIIDWDDTVFPTTWLILNNIKILNKKTAMDNLYPYFYELDIKLFDMLKKMENSKVLIITNAGIKWVYQSGKLLKKSYEYIINNINIISARDLYENKYPNDIYKWKQNTFAREIEKQLNNNSKIDTIISIGDADYEYSALINIYKTKNTTIKHFKTITFYQKPDMRTITEQIRLVTNNLNYIFNKNTNMDLKFIIK